MSFDVVIDEMRRAAKAATDAGDIAGKVDMPATVAGIAAGMSGSRSAGAAQRLGETWRNRAQTWGNDVRAYATGLSSSADLYARNEERAAQDLHESASRVRAE